MATRRRDKTAEDARASALEAGGRAGRERSARPPAVGARTVRNPKQLWGTAYAYAPASAHTGEPWVEIGKVHVREDMGGALFLTMVSEPLAWRDPVEERRIKLVPKRRKRT